jgi:hypothetical protein
MRYHIKSILSIVCCFECDIIELLGLIVLSDRTLESNKVELN